MDKLVAPSFDYLRVDPNKQLESINTPFTVQPSAEGMGVPLPNPNANKDFLDFELAGRIADETHIANVISGSKSFKRDENFALTEDLYKEKIEPLTDEKLRNYVKESNSLEELDFRAARALQSQETMKEVAARGLKGMGLYVLTSMFDPTEIAATTLVTGGLATLPRVFLRGAKAVDDAIDVAKIAKTLEKQYSVSRAFKIGAVEGAATAGIAEAVRAAYAPSIDSEDVALSIAFGGLLGSVTEGGVAAWSRMKHYAAFDKRMASGVPLTPQEQLMFSDIIMGTPKTRAERHLTDPLEAMERQDFKFQYPDNVDGVPVVVGHTGRYRTDGSYVSGTLKRGEGEKGVLYFDREFVEASFPAKPWLSPKVEGVEPLEDVFKKPEDWGEFVFRHEAAHVGNPRMENEPKPAYENRINRIAMEEYKKARAPLDEQMRRIMGDEEREMRKADLGNDLAAKATTLDELQVELKAQQSAAKKKGILPAERARLKEQVARLETQVKSLEAEIQAGQMELSSMDGVEVSSTKPIATDNPEAYANAPRQLGIRFGGMRGMISAVARAMNSEIGLTRHVAQLLGLNSSGNTDRSKVAFDALSYQAMFQAASNGRLLPEAFKARDAWKKRTPNADERVFNAEVTRAVRNPFHTSDPDVQRVASLLRAEYNRALDEAIYHKARGFVEWDDASGSWKVTNPKENYSPRIIDEKGYFALVDEIGEENVLALLRKAFKNAQPDLDDAKIDSLATGYARGIEVRRVDKALPDGTVIKMGVEDDMETILKAGLVDRLGEKGAEDALAEFQRVVKDQTGKTGIGRARRRLDLDETTTMVINGVERRIDEIFINDFEDLHQMYTYQMGGAIGLARNGIDQAGGTSFQAILNAIAREGQRLRLNEDETKLQIEALKFMHDGITGKLAHQTGIGESGEKTLRRIREFNFMVSMGASGFAALIESTNVLMEHTVKSLVKGLPRLRDMVRKMKNGELDDDLFRELQQHVGLGTDMLTGRIKSNYDDFDTVYLKSDYTAVDQALAKGRSGVAIMSGMLPLTAMMRRADTMFYALDWDAAAQAVKKGGKFKQPFSDIKMEQLGLSKADGEAIAKYINKYAEYDKNGKLVTLHLDKWKADGAEGRKVHELFTQSAYRHGTTTTQETNLGSIFRFLRTPVGKTAAQFLAYPIAATEQQFQRLATRAMYGDAGRVTGILAATAFMGSLIYMAKAYANAQGRSEKEKYEYLEKALKPEAIAFGSVSYMGASSVFGLLAQRLSGSGQIIANPTVDIAHNAIRHGKTMFGHLTEGTAPSEDELRSLMRIAPFTTLHGVSQGVNAMANYLEDNQLD